MVGVRSCVQRQLNEAFERSTLLAWAAYLKARESICTTEWRFRPAPAGQGDAGGGHIDFPCPTP